MPLPKKPTEYQDYVSVAEIAAELNCSRHTIHSWIEEEVINTEEIIYVNTKYRLLPPAIVEEIKKIAQKRAQSLTFNRSPYSGN
jgi:uncharacterized protein YjcR